MFPTFPCGNQIPAVAADCQRCCCRSLMGKTCKIPLALRLRGFFQDFFKILLVVSHLRVTSSLSWNPKSNELHFSLNEIQERCEFKFVFSFLTLLLMGSMSSRCCLKMQSMKVLLPHPLKVRANLSRATLSRSVKSKNQAHISWESCCTSPRNSLCVCTSAPNIQKIYWNMHEPHDACTKNTLK